MALHALDFTEPEVYLRGIHHVQKEASFGPPVDEAAKVRAQCALGLVRTAHPDALVEVADLLADPEPHARVGAVRALAACGGEAGVMLLRYKALLGDGDPEVLAECFLGLLNADFSRSLIFVSRFMEREDPEVSQSAILAIGTQRRPEAFEVLREKWERSVSATLRKTVLTAMATLRVHEATEFLVGLVGSVSPATSIEALKVLAACHHESSVKERIETLLERRKDRDLLAVFRAEW